MQLLYPQDTGVAFYGDDKIVGYKVYKGTTDLWELIVSKTPSDKIYTIGDNEKYTDIPTSTNALKQKIIQTRRIVSPEEVLKVVNLLKPIQNEYSRSRRRTCESASRVGEC